MSHALSDGTPIAQVCREMGLRSDVLPPLTDIEAGQGVGAVAACLWELAEQCRAQAVPVRAWTCLWGGALCGCSSNSRYFVGCSQAGKANPGSACS